MNREDTTRLVAAAIAAVLRQPLDGVADISRDGLAGWDSLKHVELMLAIEEAAGVQFSETEFADLASLATLVDAVIAHRTAAHAT